MLRLLLLLGISVLIQACGKSESDRLSIVEEASLLNAQCDCESGSKALVKSKESAILSGVSAVKVMNAQTKGEKRWKAMVEKARQKQK